MIIHGISTNDPCLSWIMMLNVDTDLQETNDKLKIKKTQQNNEFKSRNHVSSLYYLIIRQNNDTMRRTLCACVTKKQY